MAESIALGARCLDDLAVTRADAAQSMFRGHEVPAPQTAGTWLRRFTLGHIGQLNKALEIVQRNALGASGATEVTLDFDSTYVFSRSTRRQGVDRTYKRGYALHPLLCFEASSGVAVRRSPAEGQGGSFERDRDLRGRDAAPSAGRGERAQSARLGVLFGALFGQRFEQAGVTYLCGVPMIPISRDRDEIGPESWARCLDENVNSIWPHRDHLIWPHPKSPGRPRLLESSPFRREV